MSAHIGALQDQVNALYNDLNGLRAQLGQGMSIPHPQQSAAIDP